MTQEQYERAIQINGRLNDLEMVKCEIDRRNASLVYAYQQMCEYSIETQICREVVMAKLHDILNRHDKMIREEIDEEMRALEKEIESL